MMFRARGFSKVVLLAALAGVSCGCGRTTDGVPVVPAAGRIVSNAPRKTFLERLADRSRGPFLIAHRGCQSLAPENTIASFICAARLGLDAIETDVRLSADGALVCVHDDTLKRMFGIEREVSSMSLEELRKLIPVKGKDKGKDKRKIKVNGLESWPKEMLRIPTFAEYLDVCERYDKVPFIETKGRFRLDSSVFRTLCQAPGVLFDELVEPGDE